MRSRREQFRQWIATRPARVRCLAHKLKPWDAYRIKATGQYAVLRSYCEDGTVTVYTQHPLMGDYVVFGLEPADLERLREAAGGGEG